MAQLPQQFNQGGLGETVQSCDLEPACNGSRSKAIAGLGGGAAPGAAKRCCFQRLLSPNCYWMHFSNKQNAMMRNKVTQVPHFRHFMSAF